MKNGSFWVRCPWGYILSKISNRKEWKIRDILFSERTSWDLERWLTLEPDSNRCNRNLSELVLVSVGQCFGVDWQKLRPNDSFDKELFLPTEKLHKEMYSEMLDCVTLMFEFHLDLKDYKYNPEAPRITTVIELMKWSQLMWNTYPHIGEPEWKEWMR